MSHPLELCLLLFLTTSMMRTKGLTVISACSLLYGICFEDSIFCHQMIIID